MHPMDAGLILLFETQGRETKVEVRLSNDTVWLTADQMAELFQRNSPQFRDTSKLCLKAVSYSRIQLLQKMQQLLQTAKHMSFRTIT